MSRHLVLPGIAFLTLILLSACSDDDPTAPDCPCADGVIEIPGEVATLAEAVAIASDGDSLVIAAGTYDGAVTVTQDLAIVGAADAAARPVLSTLDGPLRFELAGGGATLADLVISGGETGLDLDLDTSSLQVSDCEITGAVTGVAVTGSRGDLALNAMVFRDCGAGGGVAVQGEVAVRISDARFLQDGGAGVAVTASQESRVSLSDITIEDHDAGGGAVIAATGEARIDLNDVEFRRCGGDMVFSRGAQVSLSRVEFDACAGTMVRIDEYQQATTIFESHMHDCTGSFLQADDRQVVRLTSCSFVDNEGTLIQMGGFGSLRMINCTVAGVSAGSVAAVEPYSQTSLEFCIVTEVAPPVLALPGDPGSFVLDILSSDLWRAGGSAWEGLEAYLGVNGNIEADPLYCEPGAGDYRLQSGSPCVVDETRWMGAFVVGCE